MQDYRGPVRVAIMCQQPPNMTKSRRFPVLYLKYISPVNIQQLYLKDIQKMNPKQQ